MRPDLEDEDGRVVEVDEGDPAGAVGLHGGLGGGGDLRARQGQLVLQVRDAHLERTHGKVREALLLLLLQTRKQRRLLLLLPLQLQFILLLRLLRLMVACR